MCLSAKRPMDRRTAVGLEEQEVEAQWSDLVRDVRASGQLGRCLPVCDVSGSMEGQPIDVAIALSLLLSELAEQPWRCLFHGTRSEKLFDHPFKGHVRGFPPKRGRQRDGWFG